MADERRRFSRKKAVIPVKIVNGDNSVEHIHTLYIGSSGVRLGGLRAQLKVGEIIVLHRSVKNAKFRMVWIRRLSPNEVHVGVEAVENQNSLFGFGVSENGSEMKAEITLPGV